MKVSIDKLKELAESWEKEAASKKLKGVAELNAQTDRGLNMDEVAVRGAYENISSAKTLLSCAEKLKALIGRGQ